MNPSEEPEPLPSRSQRNGSADPSSPEPQANPAGSKSPSPGDQRRQPAMRLRIEPVARRAVDIQQAVDRDLLQPSRSRCAAAGVAEADARGRTHLEPTQSTMESASPAGVVPVVLADRVCTVGQPRVLSRHDASAWEFPTGTPRYAPHAAQRRLERGECTVEVAGSSDSAEKLLTGDIDVGFIQGGVPIPDHLVTLELPRGEWMLTATRGGKGSQVRQVLTSTRNQGSHSVAVTFFDVLGTAKDVTYVHDWKSLTEDPESYEIPADVDCVFVVKDSPTCRHSKRSTRSSRPVFDSRVHSSEPAVSDSSFSSPPRCRLAIFSA
ncbi:MAG: hypothetical protein R3B96_18155 [Pirellulaceae bacterium]